MTETLKKVDFGFPRMSAVDIEEAQMRSVQNRVDALNALVDKDDGTGIQCDKCKNKGYIAFISEETKNIKTRECKCAGTRLTIKRLQSCGIWERAMRCKLESFQTDTELRKSMKKTVEQFIEDSSGKWLVLCGQSGAGKTHLCTAAFVKLTHKLGFAGEYMLWNADGRKLKSNSMDDDEKLWSKYKETKLLYIDDLFKTMQGENPSSADIRMAFEILDYRYNNRLTTIISSEIPFDKMRKLDEAIAGRIREMCGPFLVTISPDEKKNWRMK